VAKLEKYLVEIGEAIVRFDQSRTGICEMTLPDAQNTSILSLALHHEQLAEKDTRRSSKLLATTFNSELATELNPRMKHKSQLDTTFRSTLNKTHHSDRQYIWTGSSKHTL
jgi:hypothetical protein